MKIPELKFEIVMGPTDRGANVAIQNVRLNGEIVKPGDMSEEVVEPVYCALLLAMKGLEQRIGSLNTVEETKDVKNTKKYQS